MREERAQRRIVVGAASFLAGAAALCLFSTFQKWLVDAPFTLRGYLAPMLIGGVVGSFIGLRHLRLRATAAALLKEKNFCSSAIKSLPGILYVFDEQGHFIRWNETLERVGGYSTEEIERMNPLEFVVPRDQALATEKIREVFEMGQASCELGFLTKGGAELTFFHTGVRTEIDGVSCLVGVGIDISERKRAEEDRLRLEAQVQHAQKLESLGVLAGGIAHDFNNLLVGIVGHVGLAQLELPAGGPAAEALRQIEIAAQRAAELANQMLAYSGKGRLAVESVDISALVEEMAHLLKVSISKKANLRFAITPNLPLIEADATQLRQVVMNLITNASDALHDESGEIVVTTGLVRADRAYLADMHLTEDLPAGTYLFLEVSDTGCGMDERTLAKVFDPFFTTKFAGRGLGLAAVLGIVRGHGGGLKVTTRPGGGTQFRVLLPCEAGGGRLAAKAAGTACGVNDDWRGSGTILVADDEEVVRTVARMMLERFGFTVLCAADGAATVDLFDARRDEIAAVLLDISMPRLGGEEVLARIRTMRPDVPVLLTSGYDEEEIGRVCTTQGRTGFIQKPYRPRELIEKLREVMEG